MNEVNTTPSTMKGVGMGLAIVHERIQLFNHEMRTNYQ
jgi:signal transduction histidine kinase